MSDKEDAGHVDQQVEDGLQEVISFDIPEGIPDAEPNQDESAFNDIIMTEDTSQAQELEQAQPEEPAAQEPIIEEPDENHEQEEPKISDHDNQLTVEEVESEEKVSSEEPQSTVDESERSFVKPFEVAKDATPEHEQDPVNVSSSTTALKEKSDSSETIDIDSLASFLEVDSNLIGSIDSFVLQKLQARVTEFTDLKSEKIVLEVNLEQSTHLSNKRSELLKTQLTKANKEVSSLKEKNSSLEASKSELEKKLVDLEFEFKSSNSASHLSQTRIDEINAEKRSTIELLEKRNREIEDYKTELNQVQKSNSQLRKELVDLETTSQTASSALTHTKFKVQSLETQLDLLTKSNDWLNKELKTISTDFSDYRKERSTELSSLQSDYDNKLVEFNSLKARFDNLSGRFDEISTSLDNALVQIKSLNDEKSQNQEEFFKEISLKDRLVKLLSKANEESKAKILHLEQQLDSSKSDVANESGVLKTELDNYKAQVEHYQLRINQLEQTVDDLTQTNNEHIPGTPVLSPAAKDAAAKYPGISLSQLYSDFSLLKKQLTQERRSKERMQQQIDAFINELEQKAPSINAAKQRVESLESELTDMSIILEATSKDKESLEKSSKELQDKLQASHSQITTLNKQRIDLARQVQSLLVQVSIRGDSRGPLTPAEKEAFNRIVQGEKIVNESDTDSLISDRLVVFQNVVDLQNKNADLLKITRELGAKLEQEEQTSKSRLENLESTAVNEAKVAILTLQEEIASTETKLSSVVRERDMFRSMLSNKGSSNILTGSLANSDSNRDSVELNSLTRENAKLSKELNSLQDDLKSVRVESETTINLLNKQISALSNEKSDLAVNLAKEKSSKTLSEERYKSLQENIKFARSENEELRKRSELLQDNLAKQDLRTQEVAEELVQTRSMVESLRSESSNLKAEKQLWKSIETRLTEENTSLIEEKSKLNALLVSLQTMERERESNAVESQRRLLVQSESLEKELGSLRNKLNENANELKQVLTRKEADSHAYQERIDSLRNELSATREELITKRSAIDQIQAHVNTLTSKLASAESRIKDFQNITNSENSESTLAQETLKLKAELEDARSNLEDATKSAADFKLIASGAEEALKSMNETFDDYKENTSSKITKLESENKALIEQVSVLNDQITSLNNEITEQQDRSVKELDAAKLEIETLRSQVSDSSKLQNEYDAKVAVIESSYKQQVAIASEAQQNYDKELQKHAQVAKAVTSLREESYQLKQNIQILSSEAKQAKEELTKSQESWNSQRVTLEEELRISKERVDDMASQNHILYNQIESLSKKQFTSEKSNLENDEIDVNDSNEELRELINLLRREKDISDAQLEVATRDLKRTSQKLELVTSELDKSRLELSKLQSRDVDAERLSKEHEKLLEEITHLNLLRESNTTLRNELHSNNAKIKELEGQLAETTQRLEPLETDIVKLNAEIVHKGQEIKLIIEEKDRWKQRSQDILNKYNRIDPEEHEKIKKEIKQLTERNEELNKELNNEKTEHSELLAKFERIKTEAQDKLSRRANEKKQLSAQLLESQNELKSLKESTDKSIEELSQQVKESQEKLAAVNNSSTSGGPSGLDAEDLRSQLASSQAELEKAKSFESKFNELASLKINLEEKIKSLEEELQESRKELESKSSGTGTGTANSEDLEAVTKAKEELEAEKKTLAQASEDLKKEREQFENDKLNNGLSKEDIDAKDKVLKEQEATLRAELEKKYAEGLEEHKSRVREVSKAKLEALANARLEKFKQESAENLKKIEKETTDRLEAEYQQKIAQLEKEYKEKLSSVGSSSDAPVSGDAADLKAQYEEQLSNLKKELEETKKKSFDEGREATLKEVGMRTKLLQGKVEKLTKDKKALEEKLATGDGPKNAGSSVPGKPNVKPANQNRANNVKTPVNSNNNNQTKAQQQNKPFQKNKNPGSNTNDNSSQGKKPNESGGLKRPAPSDKQVGSKEKKSKNDA